MPRYRVEAYVLFSEAYEVEADSHLEAAEAVLNAEGELVDDGLDFVETADRYAGEFVTANGHRLQLPDGIRKVELAD